MTNWNRDTKGSLILTDNEAKVASKKLPFASRIPSRHRDIFCFGKLSLPICQGLAVCKGCQSSQWPQQNHLPGMSRKPLIFCGNGGMNIWTYRKIYIYTYTVIYCPFWCDSPGYRSRRLSKGNDFSGYLSNLGPNQPTIGYHVCILSVSCNPQIGLAKRQDVKMITL